MKETAESVQRTGNTSADTVLFRPNAIGGEGAAETIVHVYYHAQFQQFLEVFKDLAPPRDASRFVTSCQGWLDGKPGFSAVWDHAFGQIREMVRRQAWWHYPMKRAAGVGLHLLGHGYGGDWTLGLEQTTRFPWQGFLLPPARKIKVRGDGDRARIVLSCGDLVRELHFRHEPGGWSCDHAKPLPAFDVGGQTCYLVPPGAAHALDLDEFNWDWSEDSVSGRIRDLQEAMALIRRTVPQYLPWIARVLRYIVPVKVEPEAVYHAGEPDRPGVIRMALNRGPMGLAKMLVEACIRQYAYLSSYIDPLGDGSGPVGNQPRFQRTGKSLPLNPMAPPPRAGLRVATAIA